MNFFNAVCVVVVVFIFRIYGVNAIQCGLVEIPNTLEYRIAFGEETLPGEWPFLAALHLVKNNNSRFFCGGTLISNKHILTAAHCINTKTSNSTLGPTDIEVVLGAHDLRKRNESFAKIIQIAEVHIHPDWKVYGSKKFDADIAILVLDEYVSFTNYIRPVCLPADDANIVGTIASIAGWGLRENSSEDQENIQSEGKTEVLDLGRCLSDNPYLAHISSTRMLCGAGGKGTPNSGDSGGGLFGFYNSVWVQFGVISSLALDSDGRLTKNTAALYTNVNDFKNWIFEKTGVPIPTTVSPSVAATININFPCYYRQLLRTWFVSNFDVKIKNVYVATFSGVDEFGKAPEDLKAVAFQNGTLYSLPDGIGKAFNNLKELHVGKSLGTKLIRRSNFEDMENLITLIIGENDIAILDKDTLWDLPNLKEFTLNRNKLKEIHEKTFEMNPKLSYVDLDENRLEVLPRNLFHNNALLKSLHFRSNLLQRIEIDFTNLKALRNADFVANKCIKFQYLLTNMSIEEFQTIIRTNCS